MGCGHSKINIYPKKCRSKINCKKAAPEKSDAENEEGVDTECDRNGKLEDCDSRKTIKVKPFGGPLLAQTEISSSQQNFFKMLDDKIENGPEFDSECQAERLAESIRLKSLLKDWETASAGSRSLPSTPKRKPRMAEGSRTADGRYRTSSNNVYSDYPETYLMQNVPHPGTPIQSAMRPNLQNVAPVGFGAPPVAYRQCYAPVYHNVPSNAAYASALQYQAISPMYNYQQKQYPSYNQHGSPIKSFVTSKSAPLSRAEPSYSPAHNYNGQNLTYTTIGAEDGISETHQQYSLVEMKMSSVADTHGIDDPHSVAASYGLEAHGVTSSYGLEAQNLTPAFHHKYSSIEQKHPKFADHTQAQSVTYSPSHKPYSSVPNEPTAYSSSAHKPYKHQMYSNGELIQQQIYNQQLQCQQQREYQQYKQTREQMLLQQHASLSRNQGTVHIQSVQANTKTEIHRRQYEMT